MKPDASSQRPTPTRIIRLVVYDQHALGHDPAAAITGTEDSASPSTFLYMILGKAKGVQDGIVFIDGIPLPFHVNLIFRQRAKRSIPILFVKLVKDAAIQRLDSHSGAATASSQRPSAMRNRRSCLSN